MGVDYGRRRTGLALSDSGRTLASPLGTIRPRGLDDLAARIAERARAHGVSRIVLGDPRHMDDREGDLHADVLALAKRLEERGFSTVLWDERLTTWEAERILRENRSGRRGPDPDALAAALILQAYLDGGNG